MRLKILLTALLVALFAGLQAGPAKLDDTLLLPEGTPAEGTTFAILLTGDGGWAELVRAIAEGLNATNIPTVGWNSKEYYWTRRTPDEAAKDLAALLARFRREWNRERVVLVGYSRGADVLPFLVNRLSDADRQSIDLIALLGPAQNTDFEIHWGDYLGEATSKNPLSVPPEIMKLKGMPLLVLYGADDQDSCGAALSRELGDIRALPGGHHFDRDYSQLVQPLLKAVEKRERDPASTEVPKISPQP